MNIILLSGGSGKRLWPLSNDVRSKQFLKVFKTDSGAYESMIQRVYRQIRAVDDKAKITIATSKNQVSAIQNQLQDSISVSVEPSRKDTFPAIALASVYLNEIRNVAPDEPVIVCPIDPYVDIDFFQMFKKLDYLISHQEADMILLGIEPTYPSEKYGYIIPLGKSEVDVVSMFKEKPDKATAQRFIEQGALWNGGVFAFKLGYMIDKAHDLLDFSDYQDLFDQYANLEKISFDYAVVEKEKNVKVLRFSGKWKDIGTWNTLTEVMSENTIGKAILSDTCSNVHIINELGVPVFAMGVKNMIISASPDGVLVSDKEQSSYIKPFVDKIDQRVMFAEKSWGNYHVLDTDPDGLTIKITIKPGESMNYHAHNRRDEIWVVLNGSGKSVVDGTEKLLERGSVIVMRAGNKHMVQAFSELVMIEIQIGQDIDVSDKRKFAL